jgi:hypothetical protein
MPRIKTNALQNTTIMTAAAVQMRVPGYSDPSKMPAVWPQPTKAEDEVQCHEEE